MQQRKIIHIDMDAFFASVEQRDHPELRGQAIAVGGADPRAVVSAASYEARRWGVRSAMSGRKALKLCPQLIFVPPRFEVYKAVSRALHLILEDYTDLIEPLSLDEAFLDVTTNKPGIALAQDIAREIKQRIRSELGLTASAGVSYNKFLAKVASDYRKPDGLTVIHPERAEAFIDQLPIEAFWGVGRVTAERMHALGIHTGLDLRGWSREALVQHFGKMGYSCYDFARGIDQRPVEPHGLRKSVGCELTLEHDTTDLDFLKEQLWALSRELERRARRGRFVGRSLVLKLKYQDFRIVSRSRTALSPPVTAAELEALAVPLLEEVYSPTSPVRLIGLSLTGRLSDGDGSYWYQGSLFPGL